MKRISLLLMLGMLWGCATFKELEPIPPIQSAERGFIELQRDGENFILMKGEKYFIRFPRPTDNNFYLVLQTGLKKKVHNYFTASFDDGKGTITSLVDESASHDSMSVYAIDTSKTTYYWVIDTVYANNLLTVRYRYVPQWRYIVENKYDEYKAILDNNRVDRVVYQAMGPQFDFSSLNFATEQEKLRQKNGLLGKMNDALVRLKQIFPANIASSNDTMYQRYVTLSKESAEELAFQNDYDQVLSILQIEKESAGSFESFINRVPEFMRFLEQGTRIRKPIVDYVKSMLLRRLEAAEASYDGLLRAHNSVTRLILKPKFEEVAKLYKACDEKVPSKLQEIVDFVDEYNNAVASLANGAGAYQQVVSESRQKPLWPQDSYYRTLLAGLDKARKETPEFTLDKIDRFRKYSMTIQLGQEIRNTAKLIGELQASYSRAAQVVEKINGLRPPKEYRGIIRLLRENRDLPFLLEQYPDVDDLLLKLLTDRIREQINANEWKGAEEELANLLDDRDYLNPAAIGPKKTQTVRVLESELFEQVKKQTFERVDAFIRRNETAVQNVPTLYADSAFLPVYVLTFSSESQARLLQKRKAIEEYVNQAKYYRFPENAIRLIYKELTKAPQDQGVEKARAILDHGRYYKGQDKSVRNIVDECNPAIAKLVNKPKDYRRVLVFPVNATAKSSNEYMFRINVKIPSEAKFPVYDVNIKVPPEIAQKAGTEQWFTEMTLNKKVIKTEGHMRLTAPSADNDYEAQVTPVQMEKDRDNIIEIKFKYPAFKLFEFSVMAQVPLIRKN
jgi:hypothetical protein